jgi:hypothetical protein
MAVSIASLANAWGGSRQTPAASPLERAIELVEDLGLTDEALVQAVILFESPTVVTTFLSLKNKEVRLLYLRNKLAGKEIDLK